MPGIDELAHHVRPAAGDPEGAMVLLHGRGTTEEAIAPLFDELDPDRRLVGVAPRGPLSLPPGGAHWYSVRRVGFPEPDTFLPSYERLAAWIYSLPEAVGVPGERTVLGGFSMGAVMSHTMAWSEDRPAVAGVLALSGFVPTVPGWRPSFEDRQATRAFIAHGDADPVIEVGFGRAARDLLVAGGIDVTYKESSVVHTIDPATVPVAADWLAATVPS